MTVNQISVFLENKPGQLAEVTAILSEHHVNMCALSLADTSEFGILRLIVDDVEKTAAVLREAGCVYTISPVVAAAIDDAPGSLGKIVRLLGENGVNIEYVYAFNTRTPNGAYMVFRVEDNDLAIRVLTANGIEVLLQKDLEAL